MLQSALRGLPLLVFLLAAPPAPAAGVHPQQAGQEQEDAPRFGTSVEVLRIQVIVRDEDGDFVSGLGASDFELLIGGEPRPIIDVLEMRSSRLVRSSSGSAGPDTGRLVGETAPVPLGAHRQFLIFLDLLAPTFGGLRNARSAAVDFVEDMVEPEDRLGLAMYDRWAGLELVVPFTADHEQVLTTLEDLSIGVSMRAIDPAMAGIPADEIASALGDDVVDLIQEVEATRFNLGAEQMTVALQELGEALSVVHGRKDVLLFSTGLSDSVLSSTGFARVMERATRSLRASDTVLHTLQPEVMEGTRVHDVRNMQSSLDLNNISGSIGRLVVDRGFLDYLSAETGGESYWFRHNLRRGLSAVEERTRQYYAIAFQVRAGDPGVAPLEVRVSRPGVEVRAPERLALTRTLGPLTDAQRQLRVAEALELGAERDDLSLRIAGMSLPPEGETRPMVVALEVPASELAALAGERGDDGVDLEILGLAIDVDGGIHDVFRGTASSRVAGVGGFPSLRYVNVVRVPPGAYHLKVLVREAGTDAMSVRSLRVDAPRAAIGGVRLYGPLPVAPASAAPFIWGPGSGDATSDVDLPGAVGETGPRPYPLRVGESEVAPDLGDTVVVGQTRDFYVALDGLTTHPVTGASDWRMAVEAIGPGGRVMGIEEAEVVLLDDSRPGAPRLVLRVPFPRFLAVGPNELRVRATDRVGGASAEGSWTFTLLPR